MPQIMDELDKYRQMRGPMPDIGRAMEEAARQLGLIDLVDQPEPNPWLAQASAIEPNANDRSSVPWRVRDPDLWGKLRSMQGGYQNPWPEDPQEWVPWEGQGLGQNSMNMEGNPTTWPEAGDPYDENIVREMFRQKLGQTGGHLPRDFGVGPPPDEWGTYRPTLEDLPTGPDLNMNNVSPNMNFSYYKPTGLGNPSSQWAPGEEQMGLMQQLNQFNPIHWLEEALNAGATPPPGQNLAPLTGGLSLLDLIPLLAPII